MDILHSLKINLWIVQTIALILTALVVPGFSISGPLSAFLAVITLSIVNTQIWDTALFFSVPDSLTMHALTLIFANGVVFWILVKILPGIDTKGFIAPFLAPILFSISSFYLYHHAKDLDWGKIFSTAKESVSEVKEKIKQQQSADTHHGDTSSDSR